MCLGKFDGNIHVLTAYLGIYYSSHAYIYTLKHCHIDTQIHTRRLTHTPIRVIGKIDYGNIKLVTYRTKKNDSKMPSWGLKHVFSLFISPVDVISVHLIMTRDDRTVCFYFMWHVNVSIRIIHINIEQFKCDEKVMHHHLTCRNFTSTNKYSMYIFEPPSHQIRYPLKNRIDVEN